MSEPIPMILLCPRCNNQHVDEPDQRTGWTNPPHKSHQCHFCGAIWRPADIETTGVDAINTKGKSDNFWVIPSTIYRAIRSEEMNDTILEPGDIVEFGESINNPIYKFRYLGRA